MQPHSLLDTEETNLTCQSPISQVRWHLTNKSECKLNQAEMQLELLLTFHVPALLCCTGIVLNLTTFCVFKKQHFDGPAYAYLAAISLLDAVFLVFYLFYVVSAVRCTEHGGSFPCDSSAFRIIQLISAISSVYAVTTVSFSLQTACAWLTVLLGIERYLAMRYLHFRRNRCQLADTKLTVVLVCCASFLLNLPSSFSLRTHFDRHSADNWTDADEANSSVSVVIEDTVFGRSAAYSAYSLARLGGSTLLPLLLLAVNNTLLLVLVLSHSRRARDGSGSRYLSAKRASKVLQASLKRIRAQRRLTVLLIVVIFVFLCGQVPRSLLLKDVFALLYHGCPCGSSLLWTCCPVYRRLHPVCELVYLLCLNANFFIYAALNKHFRSHLRMRNPLRRQSAAANATDTVSMPLPQLPQQTLAQPPAQLPPTTGCCQSAPRIIYGIPSNGSPSAERRNSCVAFSQHVANSVVHSMLAGNKSQGSSVSVGSSSRSLCRSDEAFGPREELDDLLGTAVMVSHL